MSKKMQDIVCIALVALFGGVAVFTAAYCGVSFINGDEPLGINDRRNIIGVLLGYVIFGSWWFAPLTGFYLSEAIEERWKD